jgi:hypothetical protein
MAASRHILAALAFAIATPVGVWAQGPVSVLTLSQLVERTDTIDTWTRRGSGARIRTATYVQSVGRTRDGGWFVEFQWHDTTGTPTSTHRVETARGTAATYRESVRGQTDSALLVVADGRATGWIVPGGQPAMLVNAELDHPFANSDLALLAIAATKPGPGLQFVIPYNTLFSANPASVTSDTLRTLAPARLRDGRREIECQTLIGPHGESYWIERATGRLLARRTAIGPFTHWHVVRGVEPPES